MSINCNPAEILFEILSAAKKNSNKDEFVNKNSVKTVWSLTFDIDESDEKKVFFAVVQVITQIETLKSATNRMNSSSKNNFIKEIIGLEKDIMNIKLSENSYILGQALSETRLISLKAIAMGLDICNQYSNINDKQINDIKEKISRLISDVNNLSISDDLKKVIIDNLDRLNLMIDNHKLYGMDGIKEAVEKGFGNIMLNNQLSELSSNDFNIKETLKNVLNLFGSVNTLITFTKNVTPMLSDATEIAKNFLFN